MSETLTGLEPRTSSFFAKSVYSEVSHVFTTDWRGVTVDLTDTAKECFREDFFLSAEGKVFCWDVLLHCMDESPVHSCNMISTPDQLIEGENLRDGINSRSVRSWYIFATWYQLQIDSFLVHICNMLSTPDRIIPGTYLQNDINSRSARFW